MNGKSRIATFSLVNSSLADLQSLYLTDCIPALTQGDLLLGPVHHLQSVINEVSINVRAKETSPEILSDALKHIIDPVLLSLHSQTICSDKNEE